MVPYRLKVIYDKLKLHVLIQSNHQKNLEKVTRKDKINIKICSLNPKESRKGGTEE
jgi:hypothetical protein